MTNFNYKYNKDFHKYFPFTVKKHCSDNYQQERSFYYIYFLYFHRNYSYIVLIAQVLQVCKAWGGPGREGVTAQNSLLFGRRYPHTGCANICINFSSISVKTCHTLLLSKRATDSNRCLKNTQYLLFRIYSLKCIQRNKAFGETLRKESFGVPNNLN